MPLREVELSQGDAMPYFDYFENVLEYYKTTENPSFGEWPLCPFERNSRFYDEAEQWFTDRGVKVLYHKNRRFLSSFIIAAEFPPSLGFKKDVDAIVKRNGWLTLYRNPKNCLDEYIVHTNLDDKTLAQRQFLTVDSEGYYAFLELLTILSSIRFYLGKNLLIEEICLKIATETSHDIDLIQRIADTYESTLMPEESEGKDIPSPRFEYALRDSVDGKKLVLQHNLNNTVQIPAASSIHLNRSSHASFSALAGNEPLSLYQGSDVVSLMSRNGQVEADFGVNTDCFTLEKRNPTLKNIRFYLTVSDVSNQLSSVQVGLIDRREDFLVFDKTGREIIRTNRTYKMGQELYFVPLTPEMGMAFEESASFSQIESPLVPIFTQNTDEEEIQVNGITFFFTDVPFSIEMRNQTPLERTFEVGRGKVAYFYSSDISFTITGELEEAPTPEVTLFRRNWKTVEGEKKVVQTPIKIIQDGLVIRPRTPLSESGDYRLMVKYNEKSKQTINFKLLPIRSMRLVGEKQIRLKMMTTPFSFNLEGDHECTCTCEDAFVTLTFPEYGTHQVDAKYIYRPHGKNSPRLGSPITFRIPVKQEVTGHFRESLTGLENPILSIEHDLLAGSSISFNRSDLDSNNDPYMINAYMEWDIAQKIPPQMNRYSVEGYDRFPLTDLVNAVRTSQVTRLLLTVSRENEELFRAEFVDEKGDITNLESEWDRGLWDEILALPVGSLQEVYITDLKQIPENSMVYGVIKENDDRRVITHGKWIGDAETESSDPVEKFLLGLCHHNPDEEMLGELLNQILISPELSNRFAFWLTKAKKWTSPYDIRPYVRMFELFPVIAMWADVARLDDNPEHIIPEISPSPEAQFLMAIGSFYIPHVRNLSTHPRFSSEFMTLNDLRILNDLGILPNKVITKESMTRTFAHFMNSFSETGKPVLSWLTLFWGRRVAHENGLSAEYEQLWRVFRGNSPLETVENDYISTLPKCRDDENRDRDIALDFRSEQSHYQCSLSSQDLTTYHTFFETLNEETFGSALVALMKNDEILRLALPNLEGCKSSSKWFSAIYLSLYAVSYQLEKFELFGALRQLYPLSIRDFHFLLPWIRAHSETAPIYNSYYEYWMSLYWRYSDV